MTVTYTFTNGTNANATEVNQNFKDVSTNNGRIINGGTVTKQGNEKLSVTSGKFIQGTDTDITLNSATLSLTAADSTNPRIDLVNVGDDDGNPSLVTGTAASSPTIPNTEDGHLALASVRVAPQETLLDDDCSSQGSWTTGSGTWTYGTSDFSTSSSGAYSYLASDSFQPMSNYVYIKAKMKIDTSLSGNRLSLNINSSDDNSGNGYSIKIGSSFHLSRYDSGSYTNLISGGSPSAGTWHTVEAFRDGNGYWTLYVDGSQVGSKVKDVTYNTFNYFVIKNEAGTNAKYWDDLLVKIGKPDTEMYEDCSSGSISSDWNVTTSGWSDSSGYFSTTTDGAEIYRDLGSTNITDFCYLRAKMRQETGTNGNAEVTFAKTAAYNGDGYSLQLAQDGKIKLVKSLSQIIDGGSYSSGTDYIIEAIKINNIWELFVNGVSKGTAIDTRYLSSLRYVVCKKRNTTNEIRIDDIVVVGSENPAYEVTDLRNVVGEHSPKKHLIYTGTINATNIYITIPANTFESFMKVECSANKSSAENPSTETVNIYYDSTELASSTNYASHGDPYYNPHFKAQAYAFYYFVKEEYDFSEDITLKITTTHKTDNVIIGVWGV